MTTSNDPDEIRADIERTRAALSDDVDDLAESVNPKNVAQRQVDKVKEAASNVKDRVMGSDDDEYSGSRFSCSWDTASRSFSVEGISEETSIPKPKAITPAASGLPCVFRLILLGACLTASPASDALSLTVSLAASALSATASLVA